MIALVLVAASLWPEPIPACDQAYIERTSNVMVQESCERAVKAMRLVGFVCAKTPDPPETEQCRVYEARKAMWLRIFELEVVIDMAIEAMRRR